MEIYAIPYKETNSDLKDKNIKDKLFKCLENA